MGRISRNDPKYPREFCRQLSRRCYVRPVLHRISKIIKDNQADPLDGEADRAARLPPFTTSRCMPQYVVSWPVALGAAWS